MIALPEMSVRVMLARQARSGALVLGDALRLAERARPHIEAIHRERASLEPCWNDLDAWGLTEPSVIELGDTGHLRRSERECAPDLMHGLRRPLRNRHRWLFAPVILALVDRRTRTVTEQRLMPSPETPWPEPYERLAHKVREVLLLARWRPEPDPQDDEFDEGADWQKHMSGW